MPSASTQPCRTFLNISAGVKQMRQSAGVSQQLPMLPRPDFLCLVNSFFALEAAKEIPPNVAAIGPVLADNVDEPTDLFPSFFQSGSLTPYDAELGVIVCLWAVDVHAIAHSGRLTTLGLLIQFVRASAMPYERFGWLYACPFAGADIRLGSDRKCTSVEKGAKNSLPNGSVIG